MELIRLYTCDSGWYVDAEKWEKYRESNHLLAAYTKTGERIHDLDTAYYRARRAENCFYGFIHPSNLSATKREAIEKREAIYKELFPSLYGEVTS